MPDVTSPASQFDPLAANASFLPIAGTAPVGGDIDYGRFLDCVHCGLCTVGLSHVSGDGATRTTVRAAAFT